MSLLETDYGPVFGKLLQVDRFRALNEGSPAESDRVRLQTLTVEQAFAHSRIDDPEAARCCWSGIWLLYDFLDESHTLSQSLETSEGSFWHAIMHRREGDFSNAKYWFRKVGLHPVYELLAAEEICEADDWSPFDFVDDCQSALRGSGETQRCVELQRCEWELLFDYCYRLAVGDRDSKRLLLGSGDA